MDGLLHASARPMADDRPTTRARLAEPRALFRGLSHELCRPLISLRAGFDLLLAGAEGPISRDQTCHVQGLRGQCDELIRLTRTYLDHAGLVRSSEPIEWGTFRLGALLDEATRQFAVRVRSRGIDWQCRLEGEDDSVETDLGCFQQILGLLVENALVHTPAGGHVGIVARVGVDSWYVEVSDDGTGIPPERIEHVFEPLVRLDDGCHPPSGSGGRRGLGMGLAICRELASRLGAEIRLRSSTEAGTSVSIEFPRPAAI